MSVKNKECIYQHDCAEPPVNDTCDFDDDEGRQEICAFLDNLLKEQDLRDQEFQRISKLRELIKNNKLKNNKLKYFS